MFRLFALNLVGHSIYTYDSDTIDLEEVVKTGKGILLDREDVEYVVIINLTVESRASMRCALFDANLAWFGSREICFPKKEEHDENPSD